MRGFWHLVLVAAAVSMVLFFGCNKVTSENYEKIRNGMTSAQVERILGKGVEQSGGGLAIGGLSASGKVVTWGDEERSITVTFANDKVVMKAQKGL